MSYLGCAALAGGCAGLAVDVSLFPLDTIKTRLQSPQGFAKAGAFRGVYAGLGSAALGSVPTATLFFCAYESVKRSCANSSGGSMPAVHMLGAGCGEIAACFTRVPVEVVKQRAQAGMAASTREAFFTTLRSEGLRGFYRGYWSTVAREIPFSCIQFPLWESFKTAWAERQGCPVSAWQSSLCGAASGGIAAAVTTPLDVAKTRIILAQKGTLESKGNIAQTISAVYSESGVRGLFAGIVPRVMWITIGGAIFLGVYDVVMIHVFKKNENQEIS